MPVPTDDDETNSPPPKVAISLAPTLSGEEVSSLDATHAVSDSSSLDAPVPKLTSEHETLPLRPPNAQRAGHPTVGSRLGGADGMRFELLEPIGSGSLGAVYLARDHGLQRNVAIKFVDREQGGAVSQSQGLRLFELEAQATARLDSENIVRIFDLGITSGVPFLVMEFLEGRSLHALLQHERPDALRATRILRDIARGLGHAHRAGIVHRDLKPSNIFILKDDRLKILDFGLAHPAARAGESSPQPLVAGTPPFMAPEQWRGEAQDGRTDIWAAGVIFFLLLTGRLPFDGDVPALRKALLSREAAPSIRSIRPDLPEEIERVLLRMLDKNIDGRFSTAADLLDALVGLEVVLARNIRSSSESGAHALEP
ncbi:MAG TPA: serine/threonine-protein kinase, partial [Polyangia bacterium]